MTDHQSFLTREILLGRKQRDMAGRCGLNVTGEALTPMPQRTAIKDLFLWEFPCICTFVVQARPSLTINCPFQLRMPWLGTWAWHAVMTSSSFSFSKVLWIRKCGCLQLRWFLYNKAVAAMLHLSPSFRSLTAVLLRLPSLKSSSFCWRGQIQFWRVQFIFVPDVPSILLRLRISFVPFFYYPICYSYVPFLGRRYQSLRSFPLLAYRMYLSVTNKECKIIYWSLLELSKE